MAAPRVVVACAVVGCPEEDPEVASVEVVGAELDAEVDVELLDAFLNVEKTSGPTGAGLGGGGRYGTVGSTPTTALSA